MKLSKFKKVYLLINIPIMLLFFILLITPFSIINKVTNMYYVGIISRTIIGIWLIFNGIWNICTDYYSVSKNNKFQSSIKTLKWLWLLIIVLGIGYIITAFMGYGFNEVIYLAIIKSNH